MKHMNRLLVAGAGMVAAGLILGAGAAEESSTNEIVVTATRENREAVKLPASVTVITSDDMTDAGNATVVDALKNVGGLYLRSVSGNPATTEVGMRGFGENSGGRVLVLLDGRRMNRPDMAGINWLGIPFGVVDRIEVVRGSESALYGDNAVAGVINIITKKGAKEPGVEVSAEAGSFSSSDEKVSAVGTSGKVSYSADVENSRTEGWRERTGFRATGGGFNLNYDFNEAFNSSLAVSYQDVEYEIPGWLSLDEMQANPRNANNHDDSAEDKYFNSDLGFASVPSDGQRVSLNLVYGRKQTDSTMTSWMSYSDAVIDTLGATPRYSLDSVVMGHKNNVLLGVDLYSDQMTVDRFADDTRGMKTASAEVGKTTVGGYLRDEFGVTESLDVSVAGRVESATITAKETTSADGELLDSDVTHDETAFTISLNQRLGEGSKVFARGGSVYRYPFVDEQVSYIGFVSDIFYSDIKPERGMSYEVGADVNFGTDLSAGATVFLLDMKDEIAWNPVTYRNENLDKARRQGVEVNAAYAPASCCKLSANYTFTEAEFTGGVNDGSKLPLVPAHKASADARFMLPFDFTLDTVVTYVGSAYLGGDYVNAGPKLPDYTVVDLFLRHTPKNLPGLAVFVGVQNLLDEEYASLGYRGVTGDGYYPSPGRSYRAGASYKF